MSAAKHTPGSWELSESLHVDGAGTYRRIQQPHFGGDIVALVCVSHKLNSDLNVCGPSNARLIAAAPDLLDNLCKAAKTLRNYEALHRAKGTFESNAKAEVNAALAKQFEAAITKATGSAA